MMQSYWQVISSYLPLSLVSFGGPSAHIALLHSTFVQQKRWINEQVFMSLLAIAQSLPGPASTQLGFSIALLKYGPKAAFLSFFVWSLPAASVIFALALAVKNVSIPKYVQKIENGLVFAAIGLIAFSAMKLSRNLPHKLDLVLCVFGACTGVIYSKIPVAYPLMMFICGLFTLIIRFFRKSGPELEPLIHPDEENAEEEEYYTQSTKTSIIILLVFFISLAIAFVLNGINGINNLPLHIFTTFYIIGSVIFGGGPVVIPLIHAYMVETGYISPADFSLGVALINSLPGPNFNFSVYCGALIFPSSPLLGSFLAYTGIFLAGLLLKLAVIPLWSAYKRNHLLKEFLRGINACAVGFVYSAVYLMWTRSGGGDMGACISALSFGLILCGVLSPVVVIIGGILGGLSVLI